MEILLQNYMQYWSAFSNAGGPPASFELGTFNRLYFSRPCTCEDPGSKQQSLGVPSIDSKNRAYLAPGKNMPQPMIFFGLT